MDNDDIIIGIIFEPSDEGKRYMKPLWHVISIRLAISRPYWICRNVVTMYP